MQNLPQTDTAPQRNMGTLIFLHVPLKKKKKNYSPQSEMPNHVHQHSLISYETVPKQDGPPSNPCF